MPYTSADDPDLPEHIQKLSAVKRRAFVAAQQGLVAYTTRPERG